VRLLLWLSLPRRPPATPPRVPYTTLFRSWAGRGSRIAPSFPALPGFSGLFRLAGRKHHPDNVAQQQRADREAAELKKQVENFHVKALLSQKIAVFLPLGEAFGEGRGEFQVGGGVHPPGAGRAEADAAEAGDAARRVGRKALLRVDGALRAFPGAEAAAGAVFRGAGEKLSAAAAILIGEVPG